jgi:superfamily II DNA or RNA helicase
MSNAGPPDPQGFNRLLAELRSMDPQGKGKVFEKRLALWIFQNYPVLKEQFRYVKPYVDWSGLTWNGTAIPGQTIGRDCGIDLVAENLQGEMVAIQAKAWEKEVLVRSDFDSFLAAATTKAFPIKYAIVTTSVSERGAMPAAREGHDLHVIDRAEMASWPIVWPQSLKDLRPIRQPTKQLREHQREAVTAIVASLGERGRFLSPPGSGKTVSALQVAKKIGAQQTLILVPSLHLLDQVIKEVRQMYKAKVLPVGSDVTISSDGSDEYIERVTDYAWKATTDAGEIADFLRKKSTLPKILISTYQSCERVAEALALPGVKPLNLTVADEAHRTAGATESFWSCVHDPSRIRSEKRLYMTATQRIVKTGNLKQELDAAGVVSMDNESVYGPVIHELPLREAIDRKIIAEYELHIVSVTDPRLLNAARNPKFKVNIPGVLTGCTARELCSQIALYDAINTQGIQSVATFHNTIEGARSYAKGLAAVNHFPSAVLPPFSSPRMIVASAISGRQSVRTRRNHLSELSENVGNRTRIVSSARCMSEGVDVPALDAVVFVEPRSSTVDIVQIAGRALRIPPGVEGKVAKIIMAVPLLPNELEHEVSKTAFRAIREVLVAMQEVDTLFAEEMIQARLGLKGGSAKLPARVHLSLPVTLNPAGLQALTTRLIMTTTNAWAVAYHEVCAYYKAHDGAWPSQRSADQEEKRLAEWVKTNRKLDKDERKEDNPRWKKLNTTEGWSWDLLEEQWQSNYTKACVHYRSHQQRWPSTTSPNLTEARLGQWVARCRRIDRDINKSDNPRWKKLNATEGWSWDPLEELWQDSYTKACAHYKSHNGMWPSDRSADISEARLGQWVLSNRPLDAMPNKRSDPHWKILNATEGWSWNPFEERWQASYAKVCAFYKAHNDTWPSRKSADLEEVQLGQWVIRSRNLDREPNKADNPRWRKLNATEGWSWDPLEETWQDSYANACTHYTSHQNQWPSAKSADQDEARLGQWVIRSRKLDREPNKSDNPRWKKLNATEGWSWDPLEERWQESYTKVCAFYKDQNGTWPPASSTDQEVARLGTWVDTNRALDSKPNKTDNPHWKRLNATEGWSWDPFEERWRDNYAKVCAHYRAHHDAWPSQKSADQEERRLAEWVQTNRKLDSKPGKEDNPHWRRLNATEGWSWDVLEERWQDSYTLAYAYYKSHQNQWPAVTSTDLEEAHLGQWVSRSRKLDREPNKADNPRWKKLNATEGWSWDPLEETWQDSYAKACTHYTNHQNQWPSQQSADPEEARLGRWVSNNRPLNGKPNKSDNPHWKKLNATEGWSWDVIEEAWHDNYAKTCAHYKAHDDTWPSKHSADQEEARLGSWVGTNRKLDKDEKKASNPRWKKLNATEGWSWDPLEERWQDSYIRACAHYKSHQQRWPSSESTDQAVARLGEWVLTNRKLDKDPNKADNPRWRRLNGTKGWLWSGVVRSRVIHLDPKVSTPNVDAGFHGMAVA